MKMMYNGTQIKSLNIKHYEISTNDCDMIASDLQAGKTAVARGKKITGTGKSFEFATYGNFKSNEIILIPNIVNTIQVASVTHPMQQTMTFDIVRNTDFAIKQVIGVIVDGGVNYPINMQVSNNVITLTCDLTIDIQLFLGKDNYV